MSAAGGVSPYSYNWGGEDPLALSVGTYTVTVTDYNGCTSTCSVTIDEPPLLTCTITKIKDVDCYGGSEGQASVSATGGVSPYSYDWGGEDPLALSVGTYTVTVTDYNGCTSTCSVTIDEPPLLTCTITKIKDVDCYGGSDGQASVSATGGVSPYSYDWGGEDPLALSAGSYIVTVTDYNGCTSTCSVMIDEPPLLTCTITKIKDVDCYGGSDGQASVSATGGVSPYSYDWGGEDPLALSVGTYTVTVTDYNGCTSTCSVTIDEPPLLTCTITKIKDVDCYGGSDGQASVSGSGGVAPYSYDWGSANPNALSAGNYTVTVTDYNGCTSTCSVTIDEPPLLTCTITKIKDVDCYGGSEGQASVSASGGVSPYSYDWGGEDPLALSAGSYTVTVTDYNGCTSTCSVTIDEPPLLTCAITKIKDVDCYGGSDGQVSVSATGGVSPYSYDWGGEDPLALSAGSYTVTVTDYNGCTSTCRVTIDEPPLLTCTITKIKDVDCYGGSDGQASVSATGGVNPYSYDWGGEDPLALSAGSYTVTVTDYNGCTSTCSVTIDEPPLLTCAISKIKDVDCYGGSDGQVSVSATGGVSPYSYDWGGEDPLALSAGSYTVTVTDYNGCTSTCSVTIDEPPLLTCTITKIKDVDCYGGSDGQASVSATGGVSPYSYDWGGEDPLALSVGTYTVTVTDYNGCTSTCSVTIDEPPLLECEINEVVDVACYGENTGSAQVDAVGGTPPYDFNWGGVDPNALEAGTYQVLVTDSNGCRSYCRVDIAEPPLLSCAATATETSCLLNDGSITVNVTGGTGQFEFSIDNGLSYQTSNVFQNLTPGNYEVTVRDANGCLSSCQMNIEVDCYDLAITKTVLSTGVFKPGDEVNFLLTIENQGHNIAYNAEFRDDPPSGLIYLGSDAESRGNITEVSPRIYRVGVLAPGQSEELTVFFRIDESFTGESLTNKVQIIVDDGDDMDSDPETDDTVDEDGDGDGDDDDEDEKTIVVNQTIEIGDFVWLDRNGDGIQDIGEPGIENIQVKLYNKRDLLVKTTVTDINGYYLFTDINPDEYYVKFIYPSQYSVSPKNKTDDARDSDIDNSNGNGTTQLYNITSNNYTIDAGLLNCAELTGTVWFDYNENDIMDVTENGINNIKVELYKYEYGEWILWEVTYTGHKPGTPSDDGYYALCVDPGDYYLRFVNPPETLVPVVFNAGPQEISSQVSGRFGYGTTNDFSVLSGNIIENINAGYYPMGTIGDLIWLDRNENGMREASEPGLSGITVMAVNSTGEIVAEAISDDEGRYMLDYLGRDDYYIEVVLPVGSRVTEAHVGNDSSIDSDIDNSNGEGTSAMMSISPGMHMPNIDIGILESVLPVEWLDFTGRRAGKHNQLDWTVGNEINVHIYEVERSEDNSFDFYTIGEVDYEETDNYENYYSYEDYNIESGKQYFYRIKQIDLDGTFDYSKVISLQSDNFTFEEVGIVMYPNPAVDRVILSFDRLTTVKEGEIMFMSSDGQLVKKVQLKDVSISPNKPISFDISDFASGTYTWILVADGFSVVDKLIKMY